ncbi:hypothetical protein IFM89_032315 [Coptis chinensis]|uniref:Exostosin GT47 domain-containing protein n=1 Tax=Coptis chinensis TaxID=261450 RepID=A0A835M550_9MAGN|nr:hypothetical protein IFM89_032315 [Coptis chinensis]
MVPLMIPGGGVKLPFSTNPVNNEFIDKFRVSEVRADTETTMKGLVSKSRVDGVPEVRVGKELNKKDRVKESFQFMKALKAIENKSDPCGGRYIYVHDLPPKFNEDMLKECKSISLWTNMCTFTSNAGLGPPLENVEGVFSNTGWYATNQFAVDVIFNNRMKQYECLTKDSSLTSMYLCC